jgi:hypothetical protein
MERQAYMQRTGRAMRVCENDLAKKKTQGIITAAAQTDPAGRSDTMIRSG